MSAEPKATTHLEPAGDAVRRDVINVIRALAMDAVQKANSGHPGMPMGMADAATALFTRHLKFDAADPHWRALGHPGRSPFPPRYRSPNTIINVPAISQRPPAASSGGTVRTATRIARYVEPQMM